MLLDKNDFIASLFIFLNNEHTDSFKHFFLITLLLRCCINILFYTYWDFSLSFSCIYFIWGLVSSMHYIAGKLDTHKDQIILGFLNVPPNHFYTLFIYIQKRTYRFIRIFKFLPKCVTSWKFSCSVTILKTTIQKAWNVILNIMLCINYWIKKDILHKCVCSYL